MTTDPVVQALIILARRGRALRLAQQQAAVAEAASAAHPDSSADISAPEDSDTSLVAANSPDTHTA